MNRQLSVIFRENVTPEEIQKFVRKFVSGLQAADYIEFRPTIFDQDRYAVGDM